MKISLNWIKDFVTLDPAISNQELVQTVTLSVCEVEGYEETGRHLTDVVAARVTAIEPHPQADKLRLVTVNYGIEQQQQVVCGASNFEVNDIVPFAREGVTLPGDFTIKKAVIRGVESCGMLCAEDELGFSDDHGGLMILPQETMEGTPLSEMFPDQMDVVMEIDNKSITHRPDLWGHYGFARELGTIYRTKVKALTFNPDVVAGSGNGLIDVEVLAGELVPRFCGLSIDTVQVVHSPLWLQHRLIRVGLRPINNMVDLTNYVMLELGQPMHAFDANKIAGGKLTVRLADKGTRVMTLYQKEVELGEDDMTICDANGASVVAGVIGGLDSGVTMDTEAVFLEAANWDPVGIRKTATRIGLRTDACQRFEKSLDPNMSDLAIQRAVEIMRLTNPGLRICGGMVDIKNKENKPISISVTTEFICRRLGKKIEDEEIISILQYLGFSVTNNGGDLKVDVPSHRRTKDVSIPEDLVEEVGRIHGFNNITPKAPLFPIERPVYNLLNQYMDLIRTSLSSNCYHEVVNYPLTCQKTEDIFGLSMDGIIKLKNPVSDQQNQMRTSLVPHFVQTILDNQKVTYDFKAYEIGRTYRKLQSGEIQEPTKLILAVSKRASDLGGAFYQLKSDLRMLLSRLQLSGVDWQPMTNHQPYQHRNISADVVIQGKIVGSLYALSPAWVDAVGLREDVCLAELHVSQLFDLGKTGYLYQEQARYPSVNFEVSLLVPTQTYFQDIKQVIVQVSPLVVNVEFLDVYYPEDRPGMKSLSTSIEFQSAQKTLNSEEVKELQDGVVSALAQAGFSLREG